MTNAEPLLHLDGLQRRFGDVTAVDDVTLSVHRGEFVSLLGPSGSGKTTTLMLIAGFEQPDAGSVFVGGEEMADVPPHKRNVGVVFQQYALFPHMTVRQNVGYALRVRRVPKADARERVAEALKLVGLPYDEYAHRYPDQLSGGQQQRVAFARALVYEPSLLLMDEPMGALDRGLRAQLQIELKELQRRLGLTILYVTHDQEEALSLSDRIALFRDGHVVQEGPPSDLYERPRTLFVARFMGDVNVAEPVVTGNPGSDHDTLHIVRPEGMRLVAPDSGDTEGRVVEVAYFGSFSTVIVENGLARYVCRLPGRAQGVAVGDSVGVTWNPGDAVPVVNDA
jgi:putative spermidine/putrescine transport system ATP-binding protein